MQKRLESAMTTKNDWTEFCVKIIFWKKKRFFNTESVFDFSAEKTHKHTCSMKILKNPFS